MNQRYQRSAKVPSVQGTEESKIKINSLKYKRINKKGMFDQRLSAKKNEIEKVEQKIIFKWAKFFLFLNKTYDSP